MNNFSVHFMLYMFLKGFFQYSYLYRVFQKLYLVGGCAVFEL